MKKTLWILGAPDPEMVVIESVLREHGELVAYATVAEKRVHPGNAYRMDRYEVVGAEAAPVDTLDIFVECGGMGRGGERHVDHHRPGDPGYGRPPAQFLAASSLGQVLRHLYPNGGIRTHADGIVRVITDSDNYYSSTPSGRGFEDFPNAAFAAAADHCLAAAYRGECPGVDPDQLMRWRVETRAAFQKRPVEELLADVERARDVLRRSTGRTRPCCGGGWDTYSCPKCDGTDVPVKSEFTDLRGREIPELPEAAVREGIPFLATVPEKDSREKIVLQAAPAGLVKKFLRGELVPGLTDLYGDPERGFAGGYPAKK